MNRIKTYNLFITFNTLVFFTSYKYYQLTGKKPQWRQHENLQNDNEEKLLKFCAVHLYKITLLMRYTEYYQFFTMFKTFPRLFHV